MIYGLVGFFLVILVLFGAMVISFKKAQAQASGKKQPDQDTRVMVSPDTPVGDIKAKVAGARTAQEYLGFTEIIGPVVQLDSNRFRTYLEVEPVNYYLMTGGEQEMLEASFRQVLDGLRFPVQIFIGSVPLDVTEHIAHLEQGIDIAPPHLQAYGRELAGFTANWVSQYSPITKKYIIVLSYDYEPNPRKPVKPEIIRQQAIQELENRSQMVLESLGRSRLGAHRLSEDEIIGFFYQVYNRGEGAVMAARNLSQENYHALYVTSGPPVESGAGEEDLAS